MELPLASFGSILQEKFYHPGALLYFEIILSYFLWGL